MGIGCHCHASAVARRMPFCTTAPLRSSPVINAASDGGLAIDGKVLSCFIGPDSGLRSDEFGAEDYSSWLTALTHERLQCRTNKRSCLDFETRNSCLVLTSSQASERVL